MKAIKRQKRNFAVWCAISIIFVLSFSLVFNITNVVAACGDNTIEAGEECDPPGGTNFLGGAKTCADVGDTTTGAGGRSLVCAAGCVIDWNASGCKGGFIDDPANKPNNVPTDFATAVSNATNWLLGFVAMLAVLVIVWGGINYIGSAGDEDRARTAKKTITYGIIGVVIAGFAYAIVKVIVVTIL